MIDQLDRDIRALMHDAGDRASHPHTWSTVLEHVEDAAPVPLRPSRSNLVLTVAAGLVLALVAGIFVVGQRRSSSTADQLPSTFPLSNIDRGFVVVPTALPSDLELAPTIISGSGPVRASSGSAVVADPAAADPAEAADRRVDWSVVSTGSVLVDTSRGRNATLNGVEWTIEPNGSFMSAIATFGTYRVEVLSRLLDDDELVALLTGLRTIPTDGLTGGVFGGPVFDADADGTLVESERDAHPTFRVAQLGGWICSALENGRGCVRTPTPVDRAMLINETRDVGETSVGSTWLGIAPIDAAFVEVTHLDRGVSELITRGVPGIDDARFFGWTGRYGLVVQEETTLVRAIRPKRVDGTTADGTGPHAALERLSVAEIAPAVVSATLIPSVLPDGWELSPVVARGSGAISSFDFRDLSRSAQGSVWILRNGDDEPGENEAGLKWERNGGPESQIFEARADSVTLRVSGANFGEQELVNFVEGLELGPITSFEPGSYDVTNDGIEVATADPNLSLSAADVGGRQCWSLATSPNPIDNTGNCEIDPFDGRRAFGVELADGIGVLDVSGEGFTQNSNDAEAPIVRTEVHLVGITDTAISSVDVTLLNGDIVTVPTQELSGQFAERFFVAQIDLDGDAFADSGPVTSIAPTKPGEDAD